MSNNYVKYIAVALVAGALVVAGYVVKKPTVVTYQTDGTKTVVGSVSSPDIMSPYFSYGGVRNWGAKIGLNQASSTVCTITSPVATSTLRYFSVQISKATTTAISVEVAKAVSGATGTTTRLAYQLLASGAKATIHTGFVATSTDVTYLNNGETDLTNVFVFSPSQNLNVKYGSALGPLNVLEGSCVAEWTEN